MVNVSIDVTDLGGEARPGDKVVFWRPRMGGSAKHAGRVISTAPVTVFLTDGKATVSDVEPGEMSVLLQCRGVESQGPVTVGVPDGVHTVTLRALLESQFEYAPPIVSAVQEAASNASASEEAAIRAQVRSEAAADRADAKVDDAINNGANLIRDEVKQDADRAVSARQAATQSESNAKVSEGAAASSASNAATSETNAKQSEDNAGDFAAVATTAATEAVDAMESASDAATAIGDSVNAAAGHADRASQSESGAAAYAQNASDAADRVGTAEQVGTWAQQAQDAADRIGTAEAVEGWANSASDSASAAEQSASKSKEYRDAAFSAASSTADELRGDLIDIAGEASSHATESSRSAARAKTSETNAATHEANSLTAAERAEFAAEETIQQVEGDFATRNYADSKAWIRRSLQLNEDLNTVVEPGIYTSYLGSMTSGLGNRPTNFVHPGYMEVTTSGGGVVFQRFTQRNSDGETSAAIRSRNSSGDWAKWQHVASGGDPFLRGPLATGTDMNTVTDTGIYLSPLFSITSSLVNRVPGTDGIPSGAFTVINAGGGLVTQRWEKISSVNQHQAVYRRHRDLQGNWSDWEDITPGSHSGAESQSTAELPESTARAEMIRQESRLRRGRVVGTGGATPVALSFDHGTTNFRNLVLPHLIRLGLPCSLAFMPDGLGTAGDDATWEELQTWSLNHGVELAHHARSHNDVPNALDDIPALEYQLLSSIDEAETNMPEVVADAFIMPGVSGTGYGGFTGGISNPSLLYTHPAGRMILSNFPVITWGMLGQAIPMTGDPVQFVDRIGIDTASFATLAQNKITSLRGSGMGISVFMHPAYLTVDGRITESRLVSFLEWLAAERDAGRVEVLTVSGFAYADSGSSRRVDLAPADAWTSHYHTVEIDPLRNWVQGAQAILETTAHTSGNFTLSATSDTGGLAASRSFTGVTTGDRLRLVFSIPKNATSITLHAYGNDRSCKLV